MGKTLEHLKCCATDLAKEFAPGYGILYCARKDAHGEYTNEHPVRSELALRYHLTYMLLLTHCTVFLGLEKLTSSLGRM